LLSAVMSKASCRPVDASTGVIVWPGISTPATTATTRWAESGSVNRQAGFITSTLCSAMKAR
jgi:hypothetical protein